LQGTYFYGQIKQKRQSNPGNYCAFKDVFKKQHVHVSS